MKGEPPPTLKSRIASKAGTPLSSLTPFRQLSHFAFKISLILCGLHERDFASGYLTTKRPVFAC